MATVQELLYDARALLDEYNEDGAIIAPSDVASLETNGLRFINMGLQEAYNKLGSFKSYNITRKPIVNLLGSDSEYMAIKEYTGASIMTKEIENARSFHFEVDNDAVVNVQQLVNGVWENIAIYQIANIQGMTAYKGLIPNSGNLTRIVFSGPTYYRFTNVALFKEPFKLSDVPDYAPWVNVVMPSDFGSIDKVVSEFPDRQYLVNNDYKIEGFNDVYINYTFEGEMRFIYKPIPQLMGQMSDVLPIRNPIATQFLVYYVAAKLAFTENPQIANFLEQKSNELKFETSKGQVASEQVVSNIYYIRG